MKKITLLIPKNSTSGNYTALQHNVKNFCFREGFEFLCYLRDIEKPSLKIENPDFAKEMKEISADKKTSEKDMGQWERTIVGKKKIGQYLLDNEKSNQYPYFTGSTSDSENNTLWRKKTADPELIERNTNGMVIITTPVHLIDNGVTCLNPDKKERERIYSVEGSDKPYRKFDGQYRRHCGGCPFPEGCIMCTLK